MQRFIYGAAVAVLVVATQLAPSVSEAQSAQQKTELATKLLAIFQKNAVPGSGSAGVIGTATIESQTRVYIHEEFDRAGRKSSLTHEYRCTLLDGDAGWICASSSQPTSLIHVK